MMKKIFLYIFLLLSGFQIFAQDQPLKLVLLRHSVKASDGTKDPDLNSSGQKYAEALNRFFSETKFDAAFSTPYKRTRQTIQTVANTNGLTLKDYQPLDIASILKQIEENGYKTVIVAGHSNTIPFLVNALVPRANLKELEETDYGKIFIVSYFKERPASSTVFVLNTIDFLE